jgi:hypothetical protein
MKRASPSHPPSAGERSAQLAAAARQLTEHLDHLPAAERVRALAELGRALHDAVAAPLIRAVAEVAEEHPEGRAIDGVRAAAGSGYPFLRAALGLVGA